MSKNKILILVGLFIVIVIGTIALVMVKPRPSPEWDPPATPTTVGFIDNLIEVKTPLKNATVTSPLVISGNARGAWYFEASAPVELRDANGKVIAQGHVTAQGDWMTEDYVPFTATLTFTKPSTGTGTLVLKNDNPSGLPEHQKELDIPVKF
jgi:hypothetical protein